MGELSFPISRDAGSLALPGQIAIVGCGSGDLERSIG